MTLNEFIEKLQTLRNQGNGDLEVFAVKGSSGEIMPLSNGYVRESTEEDGPWDIEPGTNYISIYAGN